MHEGQIFMIGVAQRQHGGSFLGIGWDLRTSWIGSIATSIDGRVIFYYQKLTPIVH
jgi:hypothetical protein